MAAQHQAGEPLSARAEAANRSDERRAASGADRRLACLFPGPIAATSPASFARPATTRHLQVLATSQLQLFNQLLIAPSHDRRGSGGLGALGRPNFDLTGPLNRHRKRAKHENQTDKRASLLNRYPPLLFVVDGGPPAGARADARTRDSVGRRGSGTAEPADKWMRECGFGQ